MAVRNTGAEKLITETAKRIFLVEGRIHATTEDIAREAGVPRTSVHYYFRSRDMLFKHVFSEALGELRQRLNVIIESDLAFRDKLEKYVETCLVLGYTYPHIETFIITEIINQNSALTDTENPIKLRSFMKQIKDEMKKGLIPEMNPLQFILNLFALIAYPSVAAPLCKKLFDVNDQTYHKLLKERKQIILSLLLRSECETSAINHAPL